MRVAKSRARILYTNTRPGGGGWVVGVLDEIKAISAQLRLGFGLSLAITIEKPVIDNGFQKK